MKTSNKILVSAFAAYLLFTAVSTAAFLRDYSKTKRGAEPLAAQLAGTRIHVLVTEHDGFDVNRRTVKYQVVGFLEKFDPESIRISNDTLYISGPQAGYADLPDLQSFLLNGVPQPIREN